MNPPHVVYMLTRSQYSDNFSHADGCTRGIVCCASDRVW